MACYGYVVLGCVEIRKVTKFNGEMVYMCCYKYWLDGFFLIMLLV